MNTPDKPKKKSATPAKKKAPAKKAPAKKVAKPVSAKRPPVKINTEPAPAKAPAISPWDFPKKKQSRWRRFFQF